MITTAKKSKGIEEKGGRGDKKVCALHRGINVSSASLFLFLFWFFGYFDDCLPLKYFLTMFVIVELTNFPLKFNLTRYPQQSGKLIS